MTTDGAVVVVHRIGGDRWQWQWVDEGAGVRLASNHTFDDPDAAARSAGRAYPGVRLEVEGEPPGTETPPADPKTRRSRRLRFFGLGVLLLCVAAMVLPALLHEGKPR